MWLMTISCFPTSETQLRKIAEELTNAGLYHLYEEQAHGERVLISVRTKTFEERELVKTIFRDAGISDFFYGEESAA